MLGASGVGATSCLGNTIVRPAPSTTLPAGVLGSLSNTSDTPSPSESFLILETSPSVAATRDLRASTS
ncbi:hypothetical protein D3C78_1518100 [compost metagenome]